MPAKGLTYEQDVLVAAQRLLETYKDELRFDLIKTVCLCETYEDFRKLMISEAVALEEELRKQGYKPLDEKEKNSEKSDAEGLQEE